MRGRLHRKQSSWLHRGRLRDVVVVMCVVSALFVPVNATRLGVAFALLAMGCSLHLLAKGQLIRNVALCTEGVYALVRHPYYLANYLIDSSFCLLSGNVYLLLLYPFLFFWAYGPTLRQEEALLASLHGDAFDAHRGTVPQVFPDAASFSRLGQMLRHFSWRRVSSGEIKRLLRFAFIGTLIALAQHLGVEGLQKIVEGQYPLRHSGAVLLALCVLFLLASALVPRRRDRTDETHDPEDEASPEEDSSSKPPTDGPPASPLSPRGKGVGGEGE